MSRRLEELMPCFQGITPAYLATCGRDGEPNITYVSQLDYVDSRHLALSCQFFNKTRRNLGENPHATVAVTDPRNFESWRIQLRYLRSETSGPLYERMAARIEVIASHTGMAGIFRLLSADVCEVVAVEPIAGVLAPAECAAAEEPAAGLPDGPLTEMRGLQTVSERIARACTLETLLADTLAALDELFGFSHAMLFVPEGADGRLVALASRGYGEAGIGGEVGLGEGLVGTVAERRRMVRLAGLAGEISYGRAIRGQVAQSDDGARLAPEIPLPGLPDAQAMLGLPLAVGDELIGVLAVESRDPLAFDEWDEAFLQVVANQIAMGIERMQEDDDAPAPAARPVAAAVAPAPRRRHFVYYRNDDCIFVDGDYLIRNVPAKILWKLLRQHRETGQREFTNRELRLDPALGLPGTRDNLESRLILLRRRLEANCPDVRLVPVRRGRFALELAAEPRLEERATA
ncbi:MAG: GAF domain-containing protein [Thermoanaerobaculia bacterium]|nr:GAF domain-containing protein [Thermoanaerobaculia bacterium]